MEFLKFHTATQVGEVKEPTVVKPRTGFNLGGLFDKILSFGTVALAFLVPIFFLPFTSEYYEFNKQALLIFATLILTLSWIGKMWVSRELRFVRTPLDLPVALFVLAYAISTITSLNLTVSILGHYGRFNGGLVSILCYALLYFVYVNNVRSIGHVKKIATALVTSAGILAVWGILDYFKIFIPLGDYAKNRFFTPAGSPNVLSYFLTSALPISMSLLAMAKSSGARVVLAVTSLASFAYIALAAGAFGNSQFPWGAVVGVAVAIVVFFYFGREAAFSRNRGIFTVILLAFLALSALFVPAVRDRIPEELRDLPKEINLDWGSSWQIAASTLRDRPLQGSGPDTFLFDFTRFRDVSLNATPYWNLRFDRANSELLQILSTVGLIGLAAFLFLIYRVVKVNLSYLSREKEADTHIISVGFAAGTLSLVVLALVFGYLSSVTAFMLWVSLAMLMRLWLEEKQVVVRSTVVSVPVGEGSSEGRRDILPGVIFFPSLLLTALLLFLFGRMYASEVYFQRSLDAARANDGRTTYDQQVSAIDTAKVGPDPWQARLDRDIYHSTFSGTNLLLANSLAGQENPDTTTIQTLVAQAINEARAGKDLNPWNVNNWEQLATVYRNIVSFAQGSDQFAEQSYVAAIQLDPTNARLRDALGTFYSQIKRYDDAINTLTLAARLKPDLAAAHFDLAKALAARADVEGTTKDRQRDYLTAAKSEYENTLKLVTKGGSDETEVNKELEAVDKKLNALGGPVSTTTAPTVSPTATPSGTKK